MRRASMVGVVGAALVLLLTAGCTAEPAPDPEVSSVTAESDAPSEERLDQTLWTLADDPDSPGEPLADDDPDVQAVRKAAALYSDLIDERSWESLDESLEAEYTFYSASAIESLGPDYARKVRNMYEENKLHVEPVSVSWLRSSISEDRTSAVAALSSTFQFVEAGESFRSESGLETGVAYIEARRIYLSKIDGAWLIDRVERQPIEKAETPKL